MGKLNDKAIKRMLLALFFVILAGGVAHAVSIDVFYKTGHVVSSGDGIQQTYLKFSDRDDSTSTWLKRDFDMNGTKVDLKAQTVDGTLINDSDDRVKSWELCINVEGDCFINNAWVGTVEIHQFVGTEQEASQTLDLRDYDLDTVELAYLYDGDLLIPLQKGDRIVYHPSEKDEFDIPPHADLTMGMIFYYLDDLKLSDYSISYYYQRDFTYGAGFIVLVALAVLWLLLFGGWKVADISYRRAMRDMSLRKSGLASMSSIYSIISFIDLKNDELIPVFTDEKAVEEAPQGPGAREKILDIFGRDTADPYRASVLKFIDTNTLSERLQKDSIALEYVSKTYGWSQIRIFAVDREEGKPLERVLFTIQDINDDKLKLEGFEKRAARVALETSTRSTFITGAADSMRLLVQGIDTLSVKVIDESNEDSIRSYARQIRNRNKLLSYLIDGVVDASTIDLNDIHVASEGYSFPTTMSDVCDIAEALSANAGLSFEAEVSPTIPERLVGDTRRLEQSLIAILVYAAHCKDAHSIKLSVFGNAHEAGEHILFSVKADGSGMTDEDAHALAEFVSDMEKYGVHAIDESVQELEGIALLLFLMGSKLNVLNDPGEGIELYFEIDQPVDGSLG